jgi:hypothetical protein
MIMRFLGRRVSEWASNQQNWTVWRLRGFLSTSELTHLNPTWPLWFANQGTTSSLYMIKICHNLSPLFIIGLQLQASILSFKGGCVSNPVGPVISFFNHRWVGFFFKLGPHRLSISIYKTRCQVIYQLFWEIIVCYA